MITFSVKRIAVGATVGLSAIFSYTSNLVAQNTFEPSLLVGEWSEAGQCNSSRYIFTSDERYRWIENQRGKWTTRFQGIYRINERNNTVSITETVNTDGNGLQVSSLTQTSLSGKVINVDDDKELPFTYTRCSGAAISPARLSKAATPMPSGVQTSQTNSTSVSDTSLATTQVGTAKCSGIRVGSPVNTRPIQKATLEPRAGGYNLRLIENKQGIPVESLLDLPNSESVAVDINNVTSGIDEIFIFRAGRGVEVVKVRKDGKGHDLNPVTGKPANFNTQMPNPKTGEPIENIKISVTTEPAVTNNSNSGSQAVRNNLPKLPANSSLPDLRNLREDNSDKWIGLARNLVALINDGHSLLTSDSKLESIERRATEAKIASERIGTSVSGIECESLGLIDQFSCSVEMQMQTYQIWKVNITGAIGGAMTDALEQNK